jgi:uncharacterized integral membrane protein
MPSRSPSTLRDSPAAAFPPPTGGRAAATDAEGASGRPPAPPGQETRSERLRRKAHRFRLHGYAVLTVALGAFLIALAVSNTDAVKVHWVFGSSHVPLVWLVLIAAVLGWLLGLLATGAFHWRTRAPRRGQGRS